MTLLVVLVLFLIIFGGGGYAWYGRGGAAPAYAPYGLVGILVVFLLIWLLLGHSLTI